MTDALRRRSRSGLRLCLLAFGNDPAWIEPQRQDAKPDIYSGHSAGMILLTFVSGMN
jgi:hypothetical protein